MKFDPQRHHRRSIRLQNYDYTQPGGYFIAIVTCQRDFLFGKIVNEEMQLSDYGRITDECCRPIPEHFSNVELGEYVIIPNHVHGIIVIRNHEDWNRIHRYIESNPSRWAEDQENLDRHK
jgi:putative transposase